MIVFGVLAGRDAGNCEVPAKTASMAAAEMGAEMARIIFSQSELLHFVSAGIN